jgi:transcriptional regulator with XRE-family HTH domain
VAKKPIPEESTILGQRVKQARERSGISLRGLARLADIEYSELSRIENGKKLRTDWWTIDKLSAALKVPLDYFAIAARADDHERKVHPRIRSAVEFARSTHIPEWAIEVVALSEWPDEWGPTEFYRAMQLALSSGRPSSRIRVPSASVMAIAGKKQG